MAIKFSKAEKKAYPLIGEICVGMPVIALKKCDYNGLKGTISEIQYGKEKETENETILDIHVDFEEHDYATTFITHPHLNGTGIGGVICGEDEIGFQFNIDSPFYQTADGKSVCPHCDEAMDTVKETQTDTIKWSFKDGEYVKESEKGSSGGMRCDLCDGLLEDESEKVFSY